MSSRYRKLQLFLIDTATLFLTYYTIAIMTSLNLETMQISAKFSLLRATALYVCVMCFRFLFGAYHSIWRYANTETYVKLVLADVLGGCVFVLIGRVYPVVYLGLASSLLILMGFIILSMTMRFAYQLFYANLGRRMDRHSGAANGSDAIHKIGIAIVGAGNVGASLADELTRNPKSHYSPYCYIDIDDAKVGKTLNGLPVLKEDAGIVQRICDLPIQEIVIALPDAAPEVKEKLYNLYKQTGCKVKIYDYLMSDDGKRTLREFRVEDLLFRETKKFGSPATSAFYAGKTILVTGGGGSIGSELCRQIAALKPGKLIILDIYENNVYEIQQELIRRYGDRLNLEAVIASVRDEARMEDVFRQYRPQIVFHAAAHKHVPLMEHNPGEAVKNNVLGTFHTANLAEKYGTEKFLLISTDKAVNPTSVMGASKRICEMIVQCRRDSDCTFTAVRFGNVLGSNGSVIPLFRKQLEAGGPLTLTDKRIVRYFMTIPEAVGLVMESCAMAKDGELFVLDMGKQVKILELAENMIRLSGLVPYQDIDIVEIGLRPGEKLYEELLIQNEELDKTDNKMIFIERDRPLSREAVAEKIGILMNAVMSDDPEKIRDAIRHTVPTYRDPDVVNQSAVQVREENDSFLSKIG